MSKAGETAPEIRLYYKGNAGFGSAIWSRNGRKTGRKFARNLCMEKQAGRKFMTDQEVYRLRKLLGEENVREQEPMTQHTSFRVGGPADLFVRVGTLAQLQEVLALLDQSDTPWYVLGKGTNLLVGDRGYRGCVITMNGTMEKPVTDTSKEEAAGETAEDLQKIAVEGCIITAGAGASLAQTAQEARKNGLTGLEFAAGIPGSVGGGLVMNAGAYDGNMDLVVEEATLLMPDGKVMTVPQRDLRLGYRRSVLKEIPAIALQVKMKLEKGDPAGIAAKMQNFSERRRIKQPLEYPSAGSTFKRPEGMFAGKLIMDAGLAGFSVGGAQVSEKHCGFVINKDHATAADVRAVIAAVQQRVWEKAGVRLEEEVIYLGDF